MEFRIKVSGGMDEETEGNLIRIPRDLRAALGLSVGEYLRLRSKKDGQIKLKVGQAYKNDAKDDNEAAYVTESIFSMLDLDDLIEDESTIKTITNLTLGADPEYFIVDRTNGRIVHPQRYFNKFGPVGHDGMLAEIRPMPHQDENQVTTNILYLLRNLISELKKVNK